MTIEPAPVVAGLALVAKHSSATTSNKQVDLERVQALFTQLRTLLEEDDAEATELVEELASRLAGTPHAPQLERVVVAIDDFDFEEALHALESLETECLEPSLVISD